MAWNSKNIILELYCFDDMMKIWDAWWCYDDKRRSVSTSFKNTNILLFVSKFYMYFCSFCICISIRISIFIVFLLHDKRRSSSTSPRNANILLSSLTLCTALHFCHICICFICVCICICFCNIFLLYGFVVLSQKPSTGVFRWDQCLYQTCIWQTFA